MLLQSVTGWTRLANVGASWAEKARRTSRVTRSALVNGSDLGGLNTIGARSESALSAAALSTWLALDRSPQLD